MQHSVKDLSRKAMLLLIPVVFLGDAATAQSSHDLRSPDKQIEVRIRTAHGVRYDVLLKGRVLLQDCAKNSRRSARITTSCAWTCKTVTR